MDFMNSIKGKLTQKPKTKTKVEKKPIKYTSKHMWWLKNVAKSPVYIVPDAILNINGNNNEDGLRMLKDNISDAVSFTKDLANSKGGNTIQSIKDYFVENLGTNPIANAKEQIKSGDFRKIKGANSFDMDMDFDLDDDFDIDSTDVDNDDSSSGSTINKNVTNNFVKVNKGSNDSNMLGYIGSMTEEITGAVNKQTSAYLSSSANIGMANGGMLAGVSESIATLVQIQSDFNSNALEYLKTISESTLIKVKETDFDKNGVNDDLADLFENFSFSKLMDIQKHNNGGMKDYLQMAGFIGADVLANPIGSLLQGGVKKLLPLGILNTLRKSSTDLTYAPMTMMKRGLNSWSEDENGVKSFIGNFLKGFIPEMNRKRFIDNSNYDKGPIQFNGLANKAIVEVIPTLLTEIRNGILGEDKYYDYNTGEFVSKEQGLKSFIREKENAFKMNLDDDSLAKLSRFMLDSNASHDDIINNAKVLKKNLASAAMDGNYIGDIINKPELLAKYGLEKINPTVFQASRVNMGKIDLDQRKGERDYTSLLNDIESDSRYSLYKTLLSDSKYGHLIRNNFNQDSIDTENGVIKSTDVDTLLTNDISTMANNFSDLTRIQNDALSYLKIIASNTSNGTNQELDSLNQQILNRPSHSKYTPTMPKYDSFGDFYGSYDTDNGVLLLEKRKIESQIASIEYNIKNGQLSDNELEESKDKLKILKGKLNRINNMSSSLFNISNNGIIGKVKDMFSPIRKGMDNISEPIGDIINNITDKMMYGVNNINTAEVERLRNERDFDSNNQLAKTIKDNRTGETTIKLSPDMNKLSDNTQKFITGHEIGHVVAGHMNNSNRNINEEEQADSIAKQIVGKNNAVNAMNEVQTKFSSNNELKERKDKIEKGFMDDMGDSYLSQKLESLLSNDTDITKDRLQKKERSSILSRFYKRQKNKFMKNRFFDFLDDTFNIRNGKPNSIINVLTSEFKLMSTTFKRALFGHEYIDENGMTVKKQNGIINDIKDGLTNVTNKFKKILIGPDENNEYISDEQASKKSVIGILTGKLYKAFTGKEDVSSFDMFKETMDNAKVTLNNIKRFFVGEDISTDLTKGGIINYILNKTEDGYKDVKNFIFGTKDLNGKYIEKGLIGNISDIMHKHSTDLKSFMFPDIDRDKLSKLSYFSLLPKFFKSREGKTNNDSPIIDFQKNLFDKIGRMTGYLFGYGSPTTEEEKMLGLKRVKGGLIGTEIIKIRNSVLDFKDYLFGTKETRGKLYDVFDSSVGKVTDFIKDKLFSVKEENVPDSIIVKVIKSVNDVANTAINTMSLLVYELRDLGKTIAKKAFSFAETAFHNIFGLGRMAFNGTMGVGGFIKDKFFNSNKPKDPNKKPNILFRPMLGAYNKYKDFVKDRLQTHLDKGDAEKDSILANGNSRITFMSKVANSYRDRNIKRRDAKILGQRVDNIGVETIKYQDSMITNITKIANALEEGIPVRMLSEDEIQSNISRIKEARIDDNNIKNLSISKQDDYKKANEKILYAKDAKFKVTKEVDKYKAEIEEFNEQEAIYKQLQKEIEMLKSKSSLTDIEQQNLEMRVKNAEVFKEKIDSNEVRKKQLQAEIESKESFINQNDEELNALKMTIESLKKEAMDKVISEDNENQRRNGGSYTADISEWAKNYKDRLSSKSGVEKFVGAFNPKNIFDKLITPNVINKVNMGIHKSTEFAGNTFNNANSKMYGFNNKMKDNLKHTGEWIKQEGVNKSNDLHKYYSNIRRKGTEFNNGINNGINGIKHKGHMYANGISNGINNGINDINNGINNIKHKGYTYANGINNGFNNGINDIKHKGYMYANNINNGFNAGINGLNNGINNIKHKGYTYANNINNGINNGINDITNGINNIKYQGHMYANNINNSINNGINDIKHKGYTYANNISHGINNGIDDISNGINDIKHKGYTYANGINNGFNNGINNIKYKGHLYKDILSNKYAYAKNKGSESINSINTKLNGIKDSMGNSMSQTSEWFKSEGIDKLNGLSESYSKLITPTNLFSNMFKKIKQSKNELADKAEEGRNRYYATMNDFFTNAKSRANIKKYGFFTAQGADMFKNVNLFKRNPESSGGGIMNAIIGSTAITGLKGMLFGTGASSAAGTAAGGAIVKSNLLTKITKAFTKTKGSLSKVGGLNTILAPLSMLIAAYTINKDYTTGAESLGDYASNIDKRNMGVASVLSGGLKSRDKNGNIKWTSRAWGALRGAISAGGKVALGGAIVGGIIGIPGGPAGVLAGAIGGAQAGMSIGNIAALAGGVLGAFDAKEIKENALFKLVMKPVNYGIEMIQKTFGGAFIVMKDAITKPFSFIAEKFTEIKTYFKETSFVEMTQDFIAYVVTGGFLPTMKEFMYKIRATFEYFIDSSKSFVSTFTDKVKDGFVYVFNGIKDGVLKVIEFIRDPSTLVDFIEDVTLRIKDFIVNLVVGIKDSVTNFVKDKWDSIVNFGKKYKEGVEDKIEERKEKINNITYDNVKEKTYDEINNYAMDVKHRTELAYNTKNNIHDITPDSNMVDKIGNFMLASELGGNLNAAYKFSHAGIGNSGTSFGVVQLDVKNNPYAKQALNELPLTNEQRSEIYNAKSRKELARLGLDHVLSENKDIVHKYEIKQIDNIIDKVKPYENAFDSEAAFYHAVDFVNQYGSMKNTAKKLMLDDGKISADEMRNVRYTTKFGRQHPQDATRRINEVDQLLANPQLLNKFSLTEAAKESNIKAHGIDTLAEKGFMAKNSYSNATSKNREAELEELKNINTNLGNFKTDTKLDNNITLVLDKDLKLSSKEGPYKANENQHTQNIYLTNQYSNFALNKNNNTRNSNIKKVAAGYM